MSHAQEPQLGYAQHFRHMIAKIEKLPREERSAMGNIRRYEDAQKPSDRVTVGPPPPPR